jgi:hypothetical protein
MSWLRLRAGGETAGSLKRSQTNLVDGLVGGQLFYGQSHTAHPHHYLCCQLSTPSWHTSMELTCSSQSAAALAVEP